jgi:hypothetical protein
MFIAKVNTEADQAQESTTATVLRKIQARPHIHEETKSLIEIISLRTKGYEKDSRKYGQFSYIIRIAVSTLSAITTVVLGLKASIAGIEFSSNLALILSGAVTILISLESTLGQGERAVVAETARRTIRRMAYEIFCLTSVRDLTDVERDTFSQQFYQTVAEADSGALRARKPLTTSLQETRK